MKICTVCLDPGHGGNNSGATALHPETGNPVLEKDLNLSMAALLETELLRRDISVVRTRTGDDTVAIKRRQEAGVNCDLFVSLHFNSASGNVERPGMEIYYPWQKQGESRELAEALAEAAIPVLVKFGRSLRPRAVLPDNDNARFPNGMPILQGLSAPAVLAEVLFLNVPEELAVATSPLFQQELMAAWADAIVAFLETIGISGLEILRQKVRENRTEAINRIRVVEGMLTEQAATDMRQNEQIADLLLRIEKLEGKTETKPPVGIPPIVNSAALVEKFARAVFGDAWVDEVGEKKPKCRMLTNALDEYYEDIERVNDQPDHPDYGHVAEEKHGDAIYLIPNRNDRSQDRIVDVVRASKGIGALAGSFAWQVKLPFWKI